jgi:hypothetical protein
MFDAFGSTKSCSPKCWKIAKRKYNARPEMKAARLIYKASRKGKLANRQYNRKYRSSTAAKAKARVMRKKHAKKLRAYLREYRQRLDVRERINAANRTPEARRKINLLRRNKLLRDPGFKMACVLRSRIRCALRVVSAIKLADTETLIGCSITQLKQHLELLFKPGMTWGNHGNKGWHIDHIKPCVSFDLTDKKQQMECFHFTNLQPLWAKENLLKAEKEVARVA